MMFFVCDSSCADSSAFTFPAACIVTVTYRFHRIGMLVLMVHNNCDIFLEGAKLLHYLDLVSAEVCQGEEYRYTPLSHTSPFLPLVRGPSSLPQPLTPPLSLHSDLTHLCATSLSAPLDRTPKAPLYLST